MHSIHWSGNMQCVFYTGADLRGRNLTPSFIGRRISTPLFGKLHPKSKNYLPHTFYIIFWNLIEIQLWDFKHVVPNTRDDTVQNLSFIAFVFFEWLEKCGVLRKFTLADASCILNQITIFLYSLICTKNELALLTII